MDLVDSLYEAAMLGDRWPQVLEAFGQQFGTKGAVIFSVSRKKVMWKGGGDVADLMTQFIDEGWMAENDRPSRAETMGLQGFITDTDLFSLDEINKLPIYKGFLIPHGLTAFCGTNIHGLEGDMCSFSTEGFATHEAAQAAKPDLNALLPHISRSVMLSSRLNLERTRAMTDAMKAIGVPAAVINAKGLIRSTNDLFDPLIGQKIYDGHAGISLADAAADKLLQSTLGKMAASHAHARSIPLPATEADKVRVLHLIPIAGDARDLFSNASILMVMAGGHTPTDIQAPLLQTLFDLTPAEARIARLLALGRSLNEIAQSSAVSIHTVRTQAKVILSKTGMATQKDLIILLKDLSLGSNITSIK